MLPRPSTGRIQEHSASASTKKYWRRVLKDGQNVSQVQSLFRVLEPNSVFEAKIRRRPVQLNLQNVRAPLFGEDLTL